MEETQGTDGGALLQSAVESLLLEFALELSEWNGEDISPEVELNDLGFDSVDYHGLAGLINEEYGLDLTPKFFFEVHTPRRIAGYLLERHRDAVLSRHSELAGGFVADAAPAAEKHVAAESAERRPQDEPIAIVGMAGRLPNSENLERFWTNLEQGLELVSEVPSERWDWRELEHLTPIRWGGFMPDVDRFDAPFFAISPTEADQMDPQQRLFLQTAWQALEDAAIRPSSLAGSDAGVFVGVGTSDYWELSGRLDGHTATGGSHAVLPNRLSFLLDLHGPSEPVDTACSSSLVAVHRATEALRRGECGLAIAGGVNLMLTPSLYVALTRAGMLSPDGKCKTFDAKADGYVRGEGVAAIVLKPLQQALRDGNPVHAVIRGSAVNHGGRATSLTAPNIDAQAKVIEAAWRRAGVDPSTAGYIEAHGTGTSLGDPIEIDALKRAFERLYRDWKLEPSGQPHCGLGSVKTNIGHLEAAAGIAGLVKVVLAMRHRRLPATIHFDTPNPYISLDGSPFYITDEGRPWQPFPDESGEHMCYRAGISSFGFGGVNAHLVLESIAEEGAPTPLREEADLFVLSARDEERLQAYAGAIVEWLSERQVGLPELCHTSRTGREAMKYRLAILACSIDGIRGLLAAFLAGEHSADAVMVDSALEDEAQALHSLANRWCGGEEVDWTACPSHEASLISLPAYPFARHRYWSAEPSFPGWRVVQLMHIQDPAGAEKVVEGDSAEQVVAGICCNVLGLATIDVEQPLVELGADSILAAQIRGRIVESCRVELSFGAMLEAGSVSAIARLVESAKSGRAAGGDASDASVPPMAEETGSETAKEGRLAARPQGENPLSAAQAQFLFLDRLMPGNPAFNLPGALRIDGSFDTQAAQDAFTLAQQRHEALRCRFETGTAGSQMRVMEETEGVAELVDLADLLPRDQEARAETLMKEFVRRPFDISSGPLCRLLILELGDEEHLVVLCMHHIISDYTSVALLLSEIVSAGQGAPPLRSAAGAYADYAWWESANLPRTVEKELPYWLEKLADPPPPLALPCDFARPDKPSYRAETLRLDLDRETAETLAAFAQAHNLSVFIVLLGVFKALLYRLSDAKDLMVGCPYANRSMPGTVDMVGPLAYALILRSACSDGMDFEGLLEHVKRNVYAAFDHLYVPYTRLVEALNPKRKAGVNPLFQVLFNVIPTTGMAQGWSLVDLDTDHSDYDLFMRIHTGDAPTIYLQYSRDLFSRETAESLAEFYRQLLEFLLRYPETPLEEIALPERLEKRKQEASARLNPPRLRIASSFTARPLADGIDYWMRAGGPAVTVDFAGYNQLFQELYDQHGGFFSNDRGYNLVLFRMQDWLRFAQDETPSQGKELIRENLQELAEALGSAISRTAAPWLVLAAPGNPQESGIPESEEFDLFQEFAARLGSRHECRVCCWREVGGNAPTENLFDNHADSAGHIPYTREYFVSLATFIMRWVDSLSPARPAGLDWQRAAAGILAEIKLVQGAAEGRRQVYVAPQNETERATVAIFESVLNIEDVGVNDSFFDLGGHSLLAIDLTHKLNTAFGTRLNVADVFMCPTPRALADRASGGVAQEEVVELAAAAVLNPDLMPLPAVPAANAGSVLLTGATGFIGRFLLRELLDRTDAKIYCLVRANDRESAAKRLSDTMQKWRLWNAGDEERAVAIPGDLGFPRLKLDEATYNRLCEEVDAIYHNATSMNHLETFETARKVNVDGVQEMLRMAVTARPKSFNYVSTLGVFSALGREGRHVFDENSPIDRERHLFSSGYTTSKWVGEQLVHLAMKRGIPCNVFRLGLVAGDSKEGRYDELQSFHRLLLSCMQIGAAFEGFRYDLVITPVDYVARAMVRLAGDHPRGGGVFHLSSMDVTPMEDVFRMYNTIAEPPMNILSHREWLEEIRLRFATGETLAIIPLVQHLMNMDEQALDELTHKREGTTLIYDCTQTANELKASGIVVPRFDERLFRTYLRGMLEMDERVEGIGHIRMKEPQRAVVVES